MYLYIMKGKMRIMLDPELNYINDRPFRSEGEYLETLFIFLDLLLFADPRQRMEARGLSSDQNAGVWEELIRDRLEMTKAVGAEPAMEHLLKKLNAPSYMRYVLAFLIRCALDNAYESQAASEYGKPGLTLYDLCFLLASPSEKEDPAAVCGMLEEGRAVLQILFPQLITREQRTGQSLAGMLPVMDSRLLAILLGRKDAAPMVCGMELYVPGEKTGRNNGIGGIQKAAETLYRRRETMPAEISVLWGPEGSGKRDTIYALSDRTGQGLVLYKIPRSLPEERGLTDPFRTEHLQERTLTELALLRRECVISGLQPVILGAERLSQAAQEEVVSWLQMNMLPQTGSVFLLLETADEPDQLDNCFFLPMEELRASERILLWREVLSESTCIARERIDELANTFRLTQGQIRDAAKQARRLAGPDAPVTEELLYQVCYAKLGRPLKKHTQRVRSTFVWDDLKMHPAGLALLRDIVNCVRYRHIVMQEWNFERKLPYGTGITALFAGPPGTGKTMAAQIIANELHMELYKIDLSQLIDKYVGETEKNIKRVFVEAGRSNSVLFFDEADAIFNKRLEAGNSNDRFANIESSLLLQCIEEFSGITLLATNNINAIDAAFLRRFRFYVQFWEPDENIRYAIWSSVFPKEAPLDKDVDFRELARIFNFTGAIIKNVALQAAYLAAESSRSIGMLEIMVAVRRELEKNRRMLTQDEMGKYADLFPQVIRWNSGM